MTHYITGYRDPFWNDPRVDVPKLPPRPPWARTWQASSLRGLGNGFGPDYQYGGLGNGFGPDYQYGGLGAASVAGTGVIINGIAVPVVMDGVRLNVVNYKDDSKLHLAPLGYRNRHTSWVRGVMIHTTMVGKNYPQPGFGPDRDVEYKTVAYWRSQNREVGAHLTIDFDGSIGCHADLAREATMHGGTVNDVSIGIEIAKTSKGVLYKSQLQVAVLLVKWLCERFSIQMQCVDPRMVNTVIPRLTAAGGWGKSVVGVYGHMNQTLKKPYDPDVQPFQMLIASGFKPFTFLEQDGDYDDKRFWRPVQASLGVTADGVPGPSTIAALQRKGYPYGIYALRKSGGSVAGTAVGVAVAAGATYFLLRYLRG